MSTYRNTCKDCGDSYETHSWEPTKCPFCELNALRDTLKECVEALEFASNAYDDETSVVELAARLYDVSCTAKLTLTKAKELLK